MDKQAGTFTQYYSAKKKKNTSKTKQKKTSTKTTQRTFDKHNLVNHKDQVKEPVSKYDTV